MPACGAGSCFATGDRHFLKHLDSRAQYSNRVVNRASTISNRRHRTSFDMAATLVPSVWGRDLGAVIPN